MSGADSGTKAHCPPEHVLEDWAAGRLDVAAAAAVDEHLTGCEVCRRTVETLRRDAEVLGAWLGERGGKAEGDCLRALDLARFRDDAMTGEERAAAERHLGDCRRCQARLVGLQREVDATRRGEGTAAAQRAAGDIVEMPERAGESESGVLEEDRQEAPDDVDRAEPRGESGADRM